MMKVTTWEGVNKQLPDYNGAERAIEMFRQHPARVLDIIRQWRRDLGEMGFRGDGFADLADPPLRLQCNADALAAWARLHRIDGAESLVEFVRRLEKPNNPALEDAYFRAELAVNAIEDQARIAVNSEAEADQEKQTDKPLIEVPEGATWSDIELEFVSNESLILRVRGSKGRRYLFADLGLLHRGKRDLPKAAWYHLQHLAAHGSFATSGDAQLDGMDNKKISTLRDHLRRWTGLPGDPFEKYKRKVGWTPLFKVTDASY